MDKPPLLLLLPILLYPPLTTSDNSYTTILQRMAALLSDKGWDHPVALFQEFTGNIFYIDQLFLEHPAAPPPNESCFSLDALYKALLDDPAPYILLLCPPSPSTTPSYHPVPASSKPLSWLMHLPMTLPCIFHASPVHPHNCLHCLSYQSPLPTLPPDPVWICYASTPPLTQH